MTKTENFNLNQWEPSDLIRPEDFNADNAILDAALADLSAERIYVGSYVGDGTSNRIIELPWAPVFAVVLGYSDDKKCSIYFLLDGCTYYYYSSYWVNSTDSIALLGASLKLSYPSENPSNYTVRYILFR